MKIALIAAGAWPRMGGIENSLYFLSRELLSAGHQVKIICYQLPVELPPSEVHEGVEVIRIPILKSHRLPHLRLKWEVEQAAEGLERVFDAFQPDYIWSRYHTMGLAAIRAGWRHKLLHIFPITAELASRNIISGKAPNVKEFVKRRINYWLNCSAQGRVERELYGRAKCVVFSHFMGRELRRAYGDKYITQINPGVDLSHFTPRDALEVDRLRLELGIGSGERVILSVGRLAAYKNIPILISALCEFGDNVKLVIVGDGPEQQVLERQVKDMNLKSRVLLVGRQLEALAIYYTMADVTVVPSVVESFGQIYLESFACGTPAVGFSSELAECDVATNEVIRDGKTGRICKQFSASALAASITDLISLPRDEYLKYSDNCTSLVQERYCWKLTVENLLAITEASKDGSADEN